MDSDVRICLGAYALGYRYICKSASGAITLHCDPPRFDELSGAYVSGGMYVPLNSIVGGSCDSEPFFSHLPKKCFYSLKEYILANGDHDIMFKKYGGF